MLSIKSIAIPVSLLGAVTVMYFAGYTFNKMTKLLIIGVVVNDAIVVLKNVFRFCEEDPTFDSHQAALAGTNLFSTHPAEPVPGLP